MVWIRTVKPEVAAHEELFDIEAATGLPCRLAFILLWTQCDREGRFKWRPRSLKASMFPYDDLDMLALLKTLEGAGFVRWYKTGGKEYGWVPTWHQHQNINGRERASSIPPHPEDVDNPQLTRASRVDDATRGERNGTEQKGTERNARRHAGSSAEWDKCLSIMAHLEFDRSASEHVRDSRLDDMALARLLSDVKDDRRIKNKTGYTLGAIKKMGGRA